MLPLNYLQQRMQRLFLSNNSWVSSVVNEAVNSSSSPLSTLIEGYTVHAVSASTGTNLTRRELKKELSY